MLSTNWTNCSRLITKQVMNTQTLTKEPILINNQYTVLLNGLWKRHSFTVGIQTTVHLVFKKNSCIKTWRFVWWAWVDMCVCVCVCVCVCAHACVSVQVFLVLSHFTNQLKWLIPWTLLLSDMHLHQLMTRSSTIGIWLYIWFSFPVNISWSRKMKRQSVHQPDTIWHANVFAWDVIHIFDQHKVTVIALRGEQLVDKCIQQALQ